tara:strand:+ start:227 stop:808 length:582 start_codon:yes stop_codon:yes gene_type:complete
MPFINTGLLRKHLRVSSTSEDELIQDFYYPAAVQWIADYTGREIEQVQKVYITTLADGGETTLPAYPVQTIDSVKHSQGVMLLEDGTPMLLEDGSPMRLEAVEEGLVPSFSVDDNGVATVTVSGHDPSELLTIEFTAGYADDELPARLKQAILFLVGHFFHNRSEVDSSKMADVPEGAKRLCDPFRVRTFAGS